MLNLSNKIKYLKVVFSVLLLLMATLFTKNILDRNISHSITDEIHGINLGIESLFGKKVDILRVGETTRWVARMVYPAAIYYLNGKMGGQLEYNTKVWNYSGGYYIEEHHKDTIIKQDPNRQDFVYGMRFSLNLILLASFALAAYVITKKYGFVAANSYLILSIFSYPLVFNYDIFYHESVLIIFWNLLITLFFYNDNNISYRTIFWIGFVFVCAAFTKLTGVIFILPIIAYFIRNRKSVFGGIKLEFFVLSILFFTVLVNYKAVSFRELLYQYLSNVYRFKTDALSPSGFYQFTKIFEHIWMLLVPAIGISFINCKLNLKNKYLINIILVTAIVIILTLVDVQIFQVRHLAVPYIMLALVLSLNIQALINKLPSVRTKLGMLFFIGLVTYSIIQFNKYYDANFANDIRLSVKSSDCKKIAVIKHSSVNYPEYQILDDVPDVLNLRNDKDILLENLVPYDCLIVDNYKNNKQYTNLLLPGEWNLVNRYSNQFLFKKN